MSEALDQLVDSLLWEGYALYPYTPGATKNATPTPFGIVYPPVYAAALETTYDTLDLRCVATGPADGVLSGEVRFLASSGPGHVAEPHRVELPGVMLGALAADSPVIHEGGVPCADGSALRYELRLDAAEVGPGEYEASLCVENRTLVSSGLDRAGALKRSLLSTHPILRLTGGRFLSPLDRPCDSVNTFPILATDADDVVVGAAIVLPDHPQIAPESRGGLFDSTEIEEALLLHVKVLSDAEREEIAGADPAVRDMIARAETATPDQILALHGRVTMRDPREGEEASTVGGRTFRRGDKLLLHPSATADLQARLVDGRRATLERILIDYDGKTHLGVTIDDDPGQELMRETGRFLYFFADEVEVTT